MSEWWTANDAYIPGFLGGKRKGTRFEGNFWEWWEWKDIFGVRVVDVQCDAAVFWWERLFYTLIWRNLNRRVFRLLVVLNQVINCLSYLLFPKISNPVFSYAILCSSALIAHCWDRGSFELVNIPPVPRIFQKEIWCHQLHQLRSFYAWEKNAKIWTKAKWDKKTQLKLRVTNLSLQSFWICWILQSQATMMMKNFNGVCTPRNLKFSGKKVPMTKSTWRVNHWSKFWIVH